MKEQYFRDIGDVDFEPTACYIKKFDSSFYMGMHNHSYFELMYADKGNFRLEVMQRGKKDGKPETIIVHQGELVFIDAYLFHRLHISEEEVVIYNVELQPRPLADYNPSHINALYAVHYPALIRETSLRLLADSDCGYVVVPNLSRIDTVFRELVMLIPKVKGGIEDSISVRAGILMLFLEISKCLNILKESNIHYVKKALIYIKHHLHERITLGAIAESLGYSKNYLANQFKKYTGKTIMQMVNDMRISRSLRLLRDTSYPVSDIAGRVGFPSYSQMNHEFRRNLHLSPTECRRIFREDEMDYTSSRYSSIAIKINAEDYLLTDEEFRGALYKKGLKSRSEDLV